jgi:hypothetical protein
VELAAIGRRVCEVELDLLDLVVGPHPAPDDVPEPTPGPHDRPTAAELVDAVSEWIGGLPLGGRDAFLAKVSTRVLDTVRREIELGPALAERHQMRLARLGMSSDAELAKAIRAGNDGASVVDVVHASVVDKLLVADPRQLRDR